MTKNLFRKLWNLVVLREDGEIKTARTPAYVLQRIQVNCIMHLTDYPFTGEVDEDAFLLRPYGRGVVNRIAPPCLLGIVGEKDGRTVVMLRGEVRSPYKWSHMILLAILMLGFISALCDASAGNALLMLLLAAGLEGLVHLTFRIPVKKMMKSVEELAR